VWDATLDAEDDRAMDACQVQDYARQLMEAHGAKAAAEAAQKAVVCEELGDREGAEIWRRIQAAIMLMRGARQN
jgi:hypothetical protein